MVAVLVMDRVVIGKPDARVVVFNDTDRAKAAADRLRAADTTLSYHVVLAPVETLDDLVADMLEEVADMLEEQE